MELPPIPIAEQIAAVTREIGYRSRVYPRLIEQGRMTPQAADYQRRVMEAVLQTLEAAAQKERLI